MDYLHYTFCLQNCQCFFCFYAPRRNVFHDISLPYSLHGLRRSAYRGNTPASQALCCNQNPFCRATVKPPKARTAPEEGVAILSWLEQPQNGKVIDVSVASRVQSFQQHGRFYAARNGFSTIHSRIPSIHCIMIHNYFALSMFFDNYAGAK